MKINHLSFLLLAFIFALISCENQTDKANIITIKEQGDLLEVDPELEQHKARDVEIFKVDDVQEVGERKYFLKGYRFLYYHNYDGELKGLQNFYPTPSTYDKAEVSWLDDTTLTIRFFNSSTQESSTLRVFGRNGAQMAPIQN